MAAAAVTLRPGDDVVVTYAADAGDVASNHSNGRLDRPVLRADDTEVAASDFGPSRAALLDVANRHGDD